MLGTRGYKDVTNARAPRLIRVTTLSRKLANNGNRTLAHIERIARTAPISRHQCGARLRLPYLLAEHLAHLADCLTQRSIIDHGKGLSAGFHAEPDQADRSKREEELCLL